MSREFSALQRARAGYAPRTPALLREPVENIVIEEGDLLEATSDADTIRDLFPRTYGRPVLRLARGTGAAASRPISVGVVLSGGQAPGGHNVISGLLDGVRSVHPDSRLFGFLGGPRGVLETRYEELTPERVEPYRNTGGFDLIGSGRDKIESPEQLTAARSTCGDLGLDGLVIVGGDDSNTNAAILAEYFSGEGLRTRVVGVPKTIDGDLQNDLVEISFGFDTATKVYSELIGNICRDAASAKKYWHFIKLMGRSASHVTLECALKTHPNFAVIAEEVLERGLTYDEIVRQIADVVRRRSESGRNYGVCLVPEGLVEFIPRMSALIAELNTIAAGHEEAFSRLPGFDEKKAYVADKLSADSRPIFYSLPDDMARTLLLERDAHGNLQVSQIETEKLLIEGVERALTGLRAEGRFQGKFSAQSHFFGYEGRCAAPSNFDADYTYTLGRLAALLVHFDRTGYICNVCGLAGPAEDWRPAAVPITSMLNMELRKGRQKPVIRKALVRTDGAAFGRFAAERDGWAEGDEYVFPGAIQYFGPPEVCDRPAETILLERGA
jgi:pyrophosphate--fructose-6-phosphate 1-phosphotransferase